MRGMTKTVLVLLTSAAAAQATGQDGAMAERIAAFGRIHFVQSPALSPDGSKLAYLSNASGSPQLWIETIATGDARQITNLPDPVGGVDWSPDGQWLAYTVAPGGGLNTQIWLMRPDGTGASRLTAGGKENNWLDGWTDDSRFIRISTNQKTPAGMDAMLLDPTTGAMRAVVTDKGMNGIVDTAGSWASVTRLVGRGDTNLYAVHLESGSEVLLTPHEGKAQSGWAQFGGDGRTLYVMSDVGRDRAAFGTITLGSDGEVSPIRYFASRDDAVADGGLLSPDGRVAVLAWNVAGSTELAWYDTATGKVRKGPTLPFDIGRPATFDKAGRLLAMTGGGANQTTDAYLIDVLSNRVTRVTESRHDGVELKTLVRPELITYAANDGTPLSGWLYRPAGAKRALPLVFSYHGGPEGQARPTMSPDAQALVASGIAVFAPNVRGSSGFGKAFMAMDDGAKRVNSIADIKASTDALVAKGIADPKRLGIMGGSYGGYMVMAGVTEYPDMFTAGANLFGIVNFESFFRETEPWMAAISTTEYGDPVKESAMLKSLSPIHKLDRIRTPLIVLHGANDTNVPVVEAEQIVASLKGRGVPVKYTLFPDEGHGWRKTPNRVRSTTEIVGFFVDHLKPATSEEKRK